MGDDEFKVTLDPTRCAYCGVDHDAERAAIAAHRVEVPTHPTPDPAEQPRPGEPTMHLLETAPEDLR